MIMEYDPEYEFEPVLEGEIKPTKTIDTHWLRKMKMYEFRRYGWIDGMTAHGLALIQSIRNKRSQVKKISLLNRIINHIRLFLCKQKIKNITH